MTQPPDPRRHTDRQLFGWLWTRYLRQHTGMMAVAFVLMSIEGSMMGAMSYMLKPMFDTVFIAGNAGAIWWIGLAFMLIFFARAITSVLQKVILSRVAQRVIELIQRDLLRHLMTLDTLFHQQHSPGYLMARIQADVTKVSSLWSQLITGAGRDVIALISLMGVAFWIDWVWTLITLIGIPLLIAPTLLAQRQVRKHSTQVLELTGRLSNRLDEVFHGINAIKLNRLETYQGDRYDRLMRKRYRGEVRNAFWSASIPGVVDIVTGIGFFGVLIYGGHEIIAGEKTVGDFMAFFTAMALAFEPIRRLGTLSGAWQTAAAGIERLVSLFDTRPTLTSPPAPVALGQGRPRIAFEDVHLDYGGLPVLRGASFVAEAGQTTALVGASGAGKSTVFNVLTRLVDPSAGAVTLDDVRVDAVDLGALRGQFSVVAQDALLFDDSLRENILLGRTDVDDATLTQVLEASHVAGFLPKLTDGLDTPAGPRGSNLSGGQRQRVAIARALLRDTPILLLDEATSALDAQSEAIVQAALERLSEGRTTLVIAHRLSTVRSADKIVVMDHGQVVEEGTHDQLMAQNGTYAALCRLQFSDDTPAPDAPVTSQTRNG